MFYTKYRPQKFEELVGLDSVKKTLLASLSKRRIGHAYLFSGPRGTGKTTTARLLAKAVNCERVESKNWDGEPCGECESCRAIEEGRFLDLVEIDAASNRGIDDIRSLREKIKLSPSSGRKKVYVIDEVHMLTREAFNALLKTLEEPPAHAIFVLATTEPEKVPETIRSRCQIFEFRRARDEEIALKLKRICEEEGEKVDSEEIKRIAKAARGGFRDAETILEQVIVGGEKVSRLVGEGRAEDLSDFVGWITKGDAERALIFISHFFEEGGDLSHFNLSLLFYLRDLLLIEVRVGEELVEAREEDFSKMRDQAKALGSGKIQLLISEFTQSGKSLSYSPIASLPLELAVISVCARVCSDGVHCERDLTLIEEKWESVLGAVKKYNHSLEAILRSVKPKGFDGNLLTLEAFYSFHKDKLSSVKNLSLVEKAAREVFHIPVRVKCVLGKKETKKENDKKSGRKRNLEQEAVEVFNQSLE